MPLVSIIVPNYNHSAYIEQRLNSIYSQIFKDYELIILDDASPDNSSELIQNSINNRINVKFLKNDENSGSTFKQWLKGLELCRGKYVWIAESDDYADEHFLEKTVAILESDDTLHCAFVQSKWVDSKGVEFLSIPHEAFSRDELRGDHFVKDRMLDGCYLYNASAVLFRKTAYLNQQPALDKILSQFKYAGDWLFWTYILKDGYLALVPEYLNYFRRVSNAVTEVGELNSGAINETFTIIKDIIRNYNVKLKMKDSIKIANRIVKLWQKTNTATRLSLVELLYKSFKISPLLSTIITYKIIRSR